MSGEWIPTGRLRWVNRLTPERTFGDMMMAAGRETVLQQQFINRYVPYRDLMSRDCFEWRDVPVEKIDG